MISDTSRLAYHAIAPTLNERQQAVYECIRLSSPLTSPYAGHTRERLGFVGLITCPFQ